MSKKQNKKKTQSSWIKPEPEESQWFKDLYYSDEQERQAQTKNVQTFSQSNQITSQIKSQKQAKQLYIPSNMNSNLALQQVPQMRSNSLLPANIEQLPQQSFQTQPSKQLPLNLFKNNQQRIILVIDHLIKTTQNEALKERMRMYNREVEQNKRSIHDAMLQMSSLDVRLVNNHRLFIMSFEETTYSFLSLTEFKKFRKIDFMELFKKLYSYIDERIKFSKLSTGMKVQIATRCQNMIPNDKIEKFVDFFFRKCSYLYQTKEIEFKRVHNKAMRQSKGNVSVIEDNEYQSRIKHYDGKSEYGIFNSVYDQGKIGRQGVYKYRLHRTIYFLEKRKFINPKQNSQTLEKARDLAVFIIKMTDIHLKNIMKQVALNAKLSGQNKVLPSYNNVCDEVSYFASEKYASKQCATIARYKYPCVLKKYFRLRGEELWRQDFLYRTLYPQIYVTLSHTRNKDHPHQQIINDYFHSAKVSQQSKDEYKKYQEPKPKASKIKIQPKHILEVLQHHKAYQNKLIVLRLKTVY